MKEKPTYTVEVETNFGSLEQQVIASNEVSALVLALEMMRIDDRKPSDNFAIRVNIRRHA